VNAVFRDVYQFYLEDIRPHVIAQALQIRKIYVGPKWHAINFYERVGRAVCGTAYVLLLLLYAAVLAGVFIIPWWLLIHGIIWISHHYRD
jgi:hypothetical protein